MQTNSSGVVWRGRPWILPAAVGRTVSVAVAAAVVVWVEMFFGVASYVTLRLAVVWWTVLAFFVIWVLGMAALAVVRASHRYVLRADSLEVRQGLVSLKTYTVVPSGFSDLEVSQGVLGRLLGYGDIEVRVQSDVQRLLPLVRDPTAVAGRIREVLSHPVVRMAPSGTPQEGAGYRKIEKPSMQ